MNQLVIEELKDPLELGEQVALLVGSRPGKLLRFRNAALARAEVNKNRDEILATELLNLALTLPLMPIDLDHKQDQVVGFYVAARVENDALLTDGVIFANRFKQAAKELANQTAGFSIEASADSAQCSVCSKTFATEGEYCEHINTVDAKVKHNAVRILYGLHAVGGGITHRPAGTGTMADINQMEFIAHMVADEAKPIEVLSFHSDTEFAVWSKKPELLSKIVASRVSEPDSMYDIIAVDNGKKIRRIHAKHEPKKDQRILAAQLLFATWANTPAAPAPYGEFPLPVFSPYLYVAMEPDFVKNTPSSTETAPLTPKREVEIAVEQAAGITASVLTPKTGALWLEPEPSPTSGKLKLTWK